MTRDIGSWAQSKCKVGYLTLLSCIGRSHIFPLLRKFTLELLPQSRPPGDIGKVLQRVKGEADSKRYAYACSGSKVASKSRIILVIGRAWRIEGVNLKNGYRAPIFISRTLRSAGNISLKMPPFFDGSSATHRRTRFSVVGPHIHAVKFSSTGKFVAIGNDQGIVEVRLFYIWARGLLIYECRSRTLPTLGTGFDSTLLDRGFEASVGTRTKIQFLWEQGTATSIRLASVPTRQR